MKYIKPFINESFDLNIFYKVQLLLSRAWFLENFVTGKDEILEISKELYKITNIDDVVSGSVGIDTIPTYSFCPELAEYGIKDGSLHDDNLYNKPADALLTKKNNFYRVLNEQNSPYLSKTVFNISDIDSLKFPIIAKNEGTYQSKGVKKFDTKEELLSAKEEYHIFQECINIAHEYRCLVFKGKNEPTKILSVSERYPQNEKAKSLRINEGFTGESADFTWTGIDFYDQNSKFMNFEVDKLVPLLKEAEGVAKGFNVYSADFAIDKEGKYWHIELNTIPAQTGINAALIYLAIYEDYYRLSIPDSDKVKIKSIMYRMVEATKPLLKGFQIDNNLIFNSNKWKGLTI